MLRNQNIVLGVVLISAGWYLLNNFWSSNATDVEAEEIITHWKSKGGFFNYRGHEIFYIDEQNDKKEVLLVLHGFPTSTWDFVPIWPEISSRFRVVTFDFLGFGFSSKPLNHDYSIVEQTDIALRLVQKLNITSFHILAHDYGVSVAQEILARKLNREKGSENFDVKSVAFLNGGLFASVYRPIFIQKLMLNPIIGTYFHHFTTRTLFGVSFKKIWGPETQPTSLEIAVFWKLINLNDGAAAQRKILSYINERAVNEKRWADVIAHPGVTPMRLINGPYDPISGAHVAELFKKTAPSGGDVVVLGQNIGHYPHVEAPKAVAAALHEFWLKVVSP